MKTVITYGTFDLLHYGHLNILKKASLLKDGGRLIVGVSTDEFAKSKGKTTVFNLEKRMSMIEDLRYVDLVVKEESYAQKLEDIIKYDVDIFVVGSDYKDILPKMPEYEKLKEKCEIVILPRTENISTSILKLELESRNANN